MQFTPCIACSLHRLELTDAVRVSSCYRALSLSTLHSTTPRPKIEIAAIGGSRVLRRFGQLGRLSNLVIVPSKTHVLPLPFPLPTPPPLFFPFPFSRLFSVILSISGEPLVGLTRRLFRIKWRENRRGDLLLEKTPAKYVTCLYVRLVKRIRGELLTVALKRLASSISLRSVLVESLQLRFSLSCET